MLVLLVPEEIFIVILLKLNRVVGLMLMIDDVVTFSHKEINGNFNL